MLGREEFLRLDAHVRRVRDVAIAHPERLFHRLDAKMDVVGAERIGCRDVEDIEDAENHQRDGALRRRRQVVDAAARMRERERLAPAGTMLAQVLDRQRTAGGHQITRHRPRDVAAVEIVEPRHGEL
jgi:hypothetical protein